MLALTTLKSLVSSMSMNAVCRPRKGTAGPHLSKIFASHSN